MITFTLPVPPSANRWHRAIGRGRVILSAEAREYMKHAATAAIAQGVEKIAAPTDVSVSIVWYRAARRGDVDKRGAIALDCLQSIAFDNDNVPPAHHHQPLRPMTAPAAPLVDLLPGQALPLKLSNVDHLAVRLRSRYAKTLDGTFTLAYVKAEEGPLYLDAIRNGVRVVSPGFNTPEEEDSAAALASQAAMAEFTGHLATREQEAADGRKAALEARQAKERDALAAEESRRRASYAPRF